MVDNDANFSNGSAGEHTYTPTAGYSATGGNIYFTVPYSDIQSGVGYFTIASVNAATAPLPIELIDFSAKCGNNKVDLKWTTASEINNDYFTIDKGKDGITFESLAVIHGAGNSSQLNYYLWTDDQATQGTSYYRLRQTDYNGSTKIFNTVESDCENNNALIISSCYQMGSLLQLDFTASQAGMHLIKIYDATGNVIFSGNKFYSAGINSEVINPGDISSGIYFINIQDENNYSIKKICIFK
jgi:hypothetical protein